MSALPSLSWGFGCYEPVPKKSVSSWCTDKFIFLGTFGVDRNRYYLDCCDDFIGVYVCQNSPRCVL